MEKRKEQKRKEICFKWIFHFNIFFMRRNFDKSYLKSMWFVSKIVRPLKLCNFHFLASGFSRISSSWKQLLYVMIYLIGNLICKWLFARKILSSFSLLLTPLISLFVLLNMKCNSFWFQNYISNPFLSCRFCQFSE